MTAPPELSGFTGHLAGVVDQVEQRFELTYGDEVAEINALDAVVAEAEMALQIARQDLGQVLELDGREFEVVMRPIEQGVGWPWLLQNAGDQRIQVVKVSAEGTASYRPATPAHIAAGAYCRDFAEYRAAQGLPVQQQQAAA